MAFTVPLDRVDRSATALVGGKGANLGELYRAGLPVPAGFVVTTEAYRAYVQPGLQARIDTLLSGITGLKPEQLEAISAAIRRLFEETPIPEAIAQAIREGYAAMGGDVAVRSSSTAEDLASASFAGQQDSFLGLAGDDAVLDGVRRCWASLWTARAIAYRAQHGVPSGRLAIAVVVQRMVPAEAAGVLFTADPVSGRRDRMVVDAVRETGEALVGGRVTPDHWEIDAATAAVVASRIARPDSPVLAPAQLSALHELGVRTAALFGAPQDLEWAWARGRLHLVQSRPITTLFPLPSPPPSPQEGLRLYLCENLVAQGLVEPLTPMGLAYFQAVAAVFSGWWRRRPRQVPRAYKESLGRIYFDITALLGTPRRREALARQFRWKDPETARALEAWLRRRGGEIPPQRFPWPKGRFGVLLAYLWKTLRALQAPIAAREAMLAQVEAEIADLQREADVLKGQEERLAFFEGRLAEGTWRIVTSQVPALFAGFMAHQAVSALANGWLRTPGAVSALWRALPHNPTTEMGLALWRLAHERGHPEASDPAIRRFLATYGHRAVREVDLGLPRWSEEPSYVLDLVALYARGRHAVDAEARFQRSEKEAAAARQDVLAAARRRGGLVAEAVVRRLMRAAYELWGLRERPKFDWVRAVALGRRVIREVGCELVREGRLEAPEDVYFVTPSDIRRPGDLRRLVVENRTAYANELKRKSIPRLIASDGETIYAAEAAAPGGLTGVPISPGLVEGRVRIMQDPTEGTLEPGEILVARSTDPGWTPLFLSAGGLIMEVGGMMSHGAVVAREYGLPGVAGVLGATSRLHTGQRVRLNGESGQVVILEPAAR